MSRRSLSPLLAAALVLAAALATGGPAEARPKETYVFVVARIDFAKSVPREKIEKHVAARLSAAIDAHPALDAALPEAAPDPEADAKKFKQYIKARRLRPFKVNVEVTRYTEEVEPMSGGPGNRSGQYLTVRVSLRLFGETIPDRVMAFTGDGSATVKLEVGKNISPRDREEANSSALDQAVAQAIAESIKKLQAPPAPDAKKKRGKS